MREARGASVYKSMDGGQTWNAVYPRPSKRRILRCCAAIWQVNDQYFGGFWLPLEHPRKRENPPDCAGFTFEFQGDKSTPRMCSSRSDDGRNQLSQQEFRANFLPMINCKCSARPGISLSTRSMRKNILTRPAQPSIGRRQSYGFRQFGSAAAKCFRRPIGPLAFAFTRTPDGGTADKPLQRVAVDFAKTKSVQTYGNIRLETRPEAALQRLQSVENPVVCGAATADSVW